MLWSVELRFGPLRLWQTRDQSIVSLVLSDMRRHLLRVALAGWLPQPMRAWAEAKLRELTKLEAWSATTPGQNGGMNDERTNLGN